MSCKRLTENSKDALLRNHIEDYASEDLSVLILWDNFSIVRYVLSL